MREHLVFVGLLVVMAIAAITNVVAVKVPRQKPIPKELLDAGAEYGIKPYPGESMRSFKRAINAARKERARVFAESQRVALLREDTIL